LLSGQPQHQTDIPQRRLHQVTLVGLQVLQDRDERIPAGILILLSYHIHRLHRTHACSPSALCRAKIGNFLEHRRDVHVLEPYPRRYTQRHRCKVDNPANSRHDEYVGDPLGMVGRNCDDPKLHPRSRKSFRNVPNVNNAVPANGPPTLLTSLSNAATTRNRGVNSEKYPSMARPRFPTPAIAMGMPSGGQESASIALRASSARYPLRVLPAQPTTIRSRLTCAAVFARQLGKVHREHMRLPPHLHSPATVGDTQQAFRPSSPEPLAKSLCPSHHTPSYNTPPTPQEQAVNLCATASNVKQLVVIVFTAMT